MSDFMNKLIPHGVDAEIALSRFAGDEDLFEKCFYMLLEDQNFELLGQFITASDYDSSFKAAHSLKGVVGNLELTKLYKLISNLVESLRLNEYSQMEKQYQNMMEEYNALRALD